MRSLFYSYESFTSSLKVWAERSPLSEWADFTVVKKLRFQIIFNFNPSSFKPPVIIKGNQNQLQSLIVNITSYVDRLLSSDYFNQNIHLKLSHKFSIPKLKSFSKLEFSTLELFDLVTNLELLTNEVEILPALNINVINVSKIKLISPIWLKVAAAAIATIGITTSTIKFLSPEQYAPQSIATLNSSEEAIKNLPKNSLEDSPKKDLKQESKLLPNSPPLAKPHNLTSSLPKSQSRSQPKISPKISQPDLKSLTGSLKNNGATVKIPTRLPTQLPMAPPAKLPAKLSEFPQTPPILTRSEPKPQLIPAKPPSDSLKSDTLAKLSQPQNSVKTPKSSPKFSTDNISPTPLIITPKASEQIPPVLNDSIPNNVTQELPNPETRQKSQSLKLPATSTPPLGQNGQTTQALRRDSDRFTSKSSKDKNLKIEVTKIDGSVLPQDLLIYENKIEIESSKLLDGTTKAINITVSIQVRWQNRQITEIKIQPMPEASSEISSQYKLEHKKINSELTEFIERSLFETFPDRDGNLEINLKISS